MPPRQALWDQPQSSGQQMTPQSMPPSALSQVNPTEKSRGISYPETEPGTDSAGKGLPLKKPTGRFARLGMEGEAGQETRSPTSSTTVYVTLLGVIALIAITATFVRRSFPYATQSLNPQVLDILGRKSLDQRNSIVLVRVGERVLVLGSSLEGMRTLAEIVEPLERDHLISLCRTQEESPDLAGTFRMLLSRKGRSEDRVDLDRQHRTRAQQQRATHSLEPSAFSQDDLEELERTLAAVRGPRE
ncbi:MAG: FliO/MopB family protein [Planctomycetaceae bacterium]|nr:FliO/MopB family protein [Planctomycetaceae bacterium]